MKRTPKKLDLTSKQAVNLRQEDFENELKNIEMILSSTLLPKELEPV